MEEEFLRRCCMEACPSEALLKPCDAFRAICNRDLSVGSRDSACVKWTRIRWASQKHVRLFRVVLVGVVYSWEPSSYAKAIFDELTTWPQQRLGGWPSNPAHSL